MRESGILLPIASLPSAYGIGCFSRHAYQFVDFLEASGQKYWQILPLGPTGYGDSPYQSFSTFAGNPYFIDLEGLIEDGLLTAEECKGFDFGKNKRYINYEKIYLSRFKALKLAYRKSNIENKPSFQKFVEENSFWLDDYALFMSIKAGFQNVSFMEWDDEIRLRRKEAVNYYRELYAEDIKFYQFIQYIFWVQWTKLKKYANGKDIKIIGDIPIYVALDSADSWSDSKLFQFDQDSNPVAVAGCPPDAFSSTGQLWGNPLYDWDYHNRTGFEWWTKRIKHCFTLYDVVRVDHFRGFDEYYSIPYGDKTAEFGTWKKGPGIEIFKKLESKLGKLNIIAEDLGYLTESVLELVKETGYPGMKVLQFAFDSREESDYLPHNYDKNCVVYTGTHDNDTIRGWLKAVNKEDKKFALDYINCENENAKDIHWYFIRLALGSVADLAIIPMQDYLGLSSKARINTPSTIGDNWRFRILEKEMCQSLAEKIKKLTKLYGRL